MSLDFCVVNHSYSFFDFATIQVAAVEQLEESKTKIEGLLGWISNIGKEKEMGGIQKDQTGKQNGNMPEYTSEKRIIGEGDDPNGNALDATDNTSLHTGKKQDGKALDLDQQLDRVQVSASVCIYSSSLEDCSYPCEKEVHISIQKCNYYRFESMF